MKGLAYNMTWLDNRRIQQKAAVWHKRNLLGADELTAIRQKHPVGFYSPNVFIRIGLAFFMCVAVFSVMGLITWGVISSSDEINIGIILLCIGGGCLLMLEVFIAKNHYRSGIDDVFLYMTLGYAITGICMLFSSVDSLIVYCLLALPLLVLAAYRYADSLIAVAAYACLLMLVALILLEIGGFAWHLLPFAGMGVGIGTYILIRKHQKRQELRFWAETLALLEILSLVTFYVSGNYFVVQQGYTELMHGSDRQSAPLPWLFWLITIVTPVVYVYKGLQNKDRILLRAGLVLVAAAVLTFKYYYSLGHHSVTLTLGGLVLFGAAYGAIRWLKKGNLAFTYEDDVIEDEESLQAEALVVTQTFGPAIGVEQPKDFTFGGGQFGGGGAGGDY